MDNFNPLSHWIDGENVTGIYCGVKFTGSLLAYTRPTPDYKNIIFSVALDKPIDVYGMKRNSIEVWSNSKDDTICRAESDAKAKWEA